MKIVILDADKANPGDLSWAPLEKLGKLEVYADTPKDKVIQNIGDAQIVISNKTVLTKEIIDACPSIKYIGLLSTGYNQIDIEAAAQRGIPVCNAPGYSTMAVAQHTIALLLELTNHVAHYGQVVSQGQWGKDGSWCFWDSPMHELLDKTIGIVGFGSIGQAVGRIATALGMRVLATGSRPTEEGKKIAEYVQLEQLLAESDVVTLHAPLLPQTKNLINAERIAQMKDGAILLNTARGGLVDDEVLANSLHSGKIAGAGLDVVSKEPIRDDNPLLRAPRCIITPHIAWVPEETRGRLLKLVETNIQAFLAGKPQNVVNAKEIAAVEK